MQKKKRPRYNQEFRENAVRLSTRQNVSDVAKELEISESSLIRWRGQMGESPVRQASASLTPREMELRLAQLERENEMLRKEKKVAEMEREILKKATAFFARENG